MAGPLVIPSIALKALTICHCHLNSTTVLSGKSGGVKGYLIIFALATAKQPAVIEEPDLGKRCPEGELTGELGIEVTRSRTLPAMGRVGELRAESPPGGKRSSEGGNWLRGW